MLENRTMDITLGHKYKKNLITKNKILNKIFYAPLLLVSQPGKCIFFRLIENAAK